MFRFDIENAIQAIAVIIREGGEDSIEYLRLLKLMYISERESIRKTGRPIISDRIVAMDHGPVMSRIYDLSKDQPSQASDAEKWSRFLVRSERFQIRLTANPGVGKLSRNEIETLQQVTRERLDIDQWKIVDETHEFSEWIQRYSKGTSKTIHASDVYQAVDAGHLYQGARQAVAEDEYFDGLLRNVSQ